MYFLPKQYRKSFRVPVRNPESEYKKIDIQFLEEIFCIKETRKIKNDQTFSVDAEKYIVTDRGNFSNGILEIRRYPESDKIRYFYRGNEVNVKKLSKYLDNVA